MKKAIIVLLLISIFLITSCKKEKEIIDHNIYHYDISSSPISIEELNEELNNAALKIAASSVGISVKHKNGLINNTGSGSGVIIKKENNDYYVLSCRHVIFNNTKTLCDEIKIYIDGNYYDSEVVYYHDQIDVAVIKFSSELDYIPATINLNNDNIDGNIILTCSSPYDMTKYFNTITVGNISNSKRIIEEENLNGEMINNNYLQFTASINTGSSGGGIFNIKGELIGIIDWMLSNNKDNLKDMNFGIRISEFSSNINQYLK